MAEVKFIRKTQEITIPIEDGNFIVDARPGNESLAVDIGNERKVIGAATEGGTQVAVAGEVKAIINFKSDPQTQINNKLTIPTGMESQILNGQGVPITPTDMPISGSTLPITSGGAYAQLAFKANTNTIETPTEMPPIGSCILLTFNAGDTPGTIGIIVSIISTGQTYKIGTTGGTLLNGTWRLSGISGISGQSYGYIAIAVRTA